MVVVLTVTCSRTPRRTSLSRPIISTGSSGNSSSVAATPYGGERSRYEAQVHAGLPGQEGVGDGVGHIGQLFGCAKSPRGRVNASKLQKNAPDKIYG